MGSFGHIGGTHYQNQHDFEPYMNAIQSGQLPVYRALTPTLEEKFIREFILQLKLGQVQAGYFTRKFGQDPRVALAAPLKTLQDWGYASIQGETILISREGLLQIDRLLHEFFLPQHRNAARLV